MFFACEDDQIFGTIVRLDAIDVMNNLVRFQRTPQDLSHHESMFGLVPLRARVVLLQQVLVSVRIDRESAAPVRMTFTTPVIQTSAGLDGSRKQIPGANLRHAPAFAVAPPNGVPVICPVKCHHDEQSECLPHKLRTIRGWHPTRCGRFAPPRAESYSLANAVRPGQETLPTALTGHVGSWHSSSSICLMATTTRPPGSGWHFLTRRTVI